MNGYGEVVGAWMIENDTCEELEKHLVGVANRMKSLGVRP